jgi:preprotein translocase subunit YajC
VDQSGGRGLLVFGLQMAAIIAIFYFLMLRPKIHQEKQHRERLQQLKRGDEVVTAGGLVGQVVHLKDNLVTVKTGDVRVVVQRDRIAEVKSGKGDEEAKAS